MFVAHKMAPTHNANIINSTKRKTSYYTWFTVTTQRRMTQNSMLRSLLNETRTVSTFGFLGSRIHFAVAIRRKSWVIFGSFFSPLGVV